MEMNEEIYANAEVAADSRDREHLYEDSYVNKDNLQTQKTGSFKQSQTSGGETTRIRCFRLTAVCLVLLCVLLLTAITVLWIKFNNMNTENHKLQTRYNNLTIERDQIQTRYNNLTEEKEKLQSQREELDSYLKLGWIYFSSSIYSISNEGKTWTESRDDCRGRGADLVIINTKEEQEFMNKLLCTRKAWIGLNDRDTEGVWKWVDDTPLITGYWGLVEPNSYAGDEDCVLTGGKPDPVWNWADYPCDDKFIWMCEKTIFN